MDSPKLTIILIKLQNTINLIIVRCQRQISLILIYKALSLEPLLKPLLVPPPTNSPAFPPAPLSYSCCTTTRT